MALTNLQRRALQVIRRRVRFDGACLLLPDNPNPFGNDTAKIREATRLYVECWIVPLLDDLEHGNTRDLKEAIRGERAHAPGCAVCGGSPQLCRWYPSDHHPQRSWRCPACQISTSIRLLTPPP